MDPFDILIIVLLFAVIGFLAILFIGRMVRNIPADSLDRVVVKDGTPGGDISGQEIAEMDNSELNPVGFEKSYQLLREKINLFKARNSYNRIEEYSYSENE